MALDPMISPIKDLFFTRNLDLVLKRLAVLDRRLTYVNQNYDWAEWSTDLEFLEYIHQALWSDNHADPQLSLEDRDEKVHFLKGFKTAPEDKVRSSTLSKVISFVKKLRRGRREGADRRLLHHDIEQGLREFGTEA
jgi:hypothetical protein